MVFGKTLQIFYFIVVKTHNKITILAILSEQ